MKNRLMIFFLLLIVLALACTRSASTPPPPTSTIEPEMMTQTAAVQLTATAESTPILYKLFFALVYKNYSLRASTTPEPNPSLFPPNLLEE